MNIRNLLTKLSELEATLREYSYENLKATEARELKDKLGAFRLHLEQKIEWDASKMSNRESKPPGSHKEPEIQQTADFATTSSQRSETGHPSESVNTTGGLEAAYLTYEQINYLNAVLASSDIAVLAGRGLTTGAEKKSAKLVVQKRSDRKFKTKYMGNARKIISKAVQPDKELTGASAFVDLTRVLEDCLGELDLLEELVQLFKQNVLEFIGQLKIHLQNMDFEGVRFAAHKIKSGLRMMKITELLIIAEQIEAVCKTDRDVKHLNFLFDCFLEEYPKIEIAIDVALEKLK